MKKRASFAAVLAWFMLGFIALEATADAILSVLHYTNYTYQFAAKSCGETVQLQLSNIDYKNNVRKNEILLNNKFYEVVETNNLPTDSVKLLLKPDIFDTLLFLIKNGITENSNQGATSHKTAAFFLFLFVEFFTESVTLFLKNSPEYFCFTIPILSTILVVDYKPPMSEL